MYNLQSNVPLLMLIENIHFDYFFLLSSSLILSVISHEHVFNVKTNKLCSDFYLDIFLLNPTLLVHHLKGERNITRKKTSIRSKAQESMYGQTDNVSFRLFSVPFIPLNARGEVVSRKRNCINGNQIYT